MRDDRLYLVDILEAAAAIDRFEEYPPMETQLL